MIWVVNSLPGTSIADLVHGIQFIVVGLLFAEKSDGLCEEAQGEKEHKVEAKCSLVLMPGSLLVFKDSAYAGKLSDFFRNWANALAYLNFPFCPKGVSQILRNLLNCVFNKI